MAGLTACQDSSILRLIEVGWLVGLDGGVKDRFGNTHIEPELAKSRSRSAFTLLVVSVVSIALVVFLVGSSLLGLFSLRTSGLEEEGADVTPVLPPVTTPNGTNSSPITFDESGVLLLTSVDSDQSTVPGAMTEVAFSPDKTMIAAAGIGETVDIWDLSRGLVITKLGGFQGHIDSIAWSPGSKRIAGGGKDDHLYLWTLDHPEPRMAFDHRDEVTAIAWAPDGSQLVTGSRSGLARTWHPESTRRIAQFATGGNPVRAVTWPSLMQGITVAHGRGFDNWNPTTGDVQELVSSGTSLTDASWSPDGSRQVSSDNGTHFYLYSSGVSVTGRPIQAHNVDIGALAWSPDGRIIATGAEDGTVALWRASDRNKLAEFEGHPNGVIGLDWLSDSTQLAVAGGTSTIRIHLLESSVLEQAGG